MITLIVEIHPDHTIVLLVWQSLIPRFRQLLHLKVIFFVALVNYGKLVLLITLCYYKLHKYQISPFEMKARVKMEKDPGTQQICPFPLINRVL